MNSKRIKVDLDDNTNKNIKFKLEQNIETYDLLTLKLSQRDIYQSFNSDFGVLMGRVNANGNVGIPNVKVSVFIPIEDADKLNDEIFQYYPYENPSDENLDGKRYNLLPRVGRKESASGKTKPKQPFGSFPIKEEIVSNEVLMEVYDKYYKYSTVTNESGDYLIFGIPIGVQTVHLSADITDVGVYSMTPSTMVNLLGYSPNLFSEDGTEIKSSQDLNELPNIETQEVSVDIIPFWGDNENYEIGITRQDFKIKAKLIKNFVIFGSTFTGAEAGIWGRGSARDKKTDNQLFQIDNNPDYYSNLVFDNHRIGKPVVTLYSYNPELSDNEIASGENIDVETDIFKVDKSSYTEYIKNGDFALNCACNRRKVIIDDQGREIVVGNNDPDGIFTEFKGYITVEYDNSDNDVSMTNPTEGRALRGRLKIPQDTHTSYDPESSNNISWIKNFHTFEGGKFYTTSMFNHIQIDGTDQQWYDRSAEPESVNTLMPELHTTVAATQHNFGVLLDSYITEGYTGTSTGILTNGVDWGDNPAFGAEWMNMTLQLPQFNDDKIYKTKSDWYCTSSVSRYPNHIEFIVENDITIGAGQVDNSRFIRGDHFMTTFVEITESDLYILYEHEELGSNKGARKVNNINGNVLTLDSDYKVGGKVGGVQDGDDETNGYIFKGLGAADCIRHLFNKNLI